jgi:hypothetical protein
MPLPAQSTGRRVLVAKGRAKTKADFNDFAEFTEHRVIAPQYKDKVKLWTLKGGKGDWDSGVPIVFRMLPGFKLMTPEQAARGEEVPIEYLNGRLEAGELVLEPNALHPAYSVVDLGSSRSRRVTFLPHIPWVPASDDDYPPYAGPRTNPYSMLLKGVYDNARALDPAFVPLTLSGKKLKEYLVAQGIRPPKVVKPLLPFPKLAVFCYVWMYKAHDSEARQAVESPDSPVGSIPDDGLQAMMLSLQVYQKLSAIYAKAAVVNGVQQNEYEYPDPCAWDAGCLNYVWNAGARNPVTGANGDATIMGYNAEASTAYFRSPRQGTKVNLAFSPAFKRWYEDNWIQWDELLHGTVGAEQVRLIAEFFPELGPVAEQVWEGDDVLMSAWEKAPFLRDKKECNMNNVLARLYASEGAAPLKDDEDLDEDLYEKRPRRPLTTAVQRGNSDSYAEEDEQEPIPTPRRQPQSSATPKPRHKEPVEDLDYEDEDTDRYETPAPQKTVRPKGKVVQPVEEDFYTPDLDDEDPPPRPTKKVVTRQQRVVEEEPEYETEEQVVPARQTVKTRVAEALDPLPPKKPARRLPATPPFETLTDLTDEDELPEEPLPRVTRKNAAAVEKIPPKPRTSRFKQDYVEE